MRNHLFRMLKQFVKDSRLSHKIVAAIIVMAVIPLILVSVFFYSKLQQIINTEMSSTYNQVFNQYVESVNYKISLYQNFLDNIVISRPVQELFSDDAEISSQNHYDLGKKFSDDIEFMTSKKDQSELYSLVVYAFDKSFPSDGRHISNVGTIEEEEWYHTLVKNGKYDNCFYHLIKGVDIGVISLVRPVTKQNEHRLFLNTGFTKLDLLASRIFKFDNAIPAKRDIDIYVLDSLGTVIYNNKKSGLMNDALIRSLAGSESGTESVGTASEKGILVYKSLEDQGWKIFAFFPNTEVNQKVRDVTLTILLIVLSFLVVFIILTILFSKLFSNRINMLVKKMRKVEKGDLQVTEFIDGRDEIGTLDKYFNQMIDKLNELIKENYIQGLEKRDAELNALQQQINPHFLYNTLESISSIALLYHSNEIVTISQKLGEMFRFNTSIGKGEFVTLEEELQHVRNYIDIQKIRFGDQFLTQFQIDDALLHRKILKFILQPIVENALLHGFESKRGQGLLEIGAFESEGTLTLRVRDNGAGMTEEQLDALEQNIRRQENLIVSRAGRSIGLKNVNSRIQLTYGDAYGLRIQSSPGVGTEVSIILPCG